MSDSDPPSEERLVPWHFQEQSGHTRNLRQRFVEARESKGLSQREVASRIAQRLGKPSHSGSAVSAYENMDRDPPIDVMAAWARAVGWRLHVDALPFHDDRQWYAVRPEIGEVALELESCDDETRDLVLKMARRMLRMDEPDR